MKKVVLLIVLFGLLFALLLAVGGEGDMPTSKIYGEAADGFILGSDITPIYANARSTSAACDFNGNTGQVGQELSLEIYGVFRSFLSFDTSNIPDDAIIITASLYVRADTDRSDDDFLVQVYRYAWAEALCDNREANYDGAYGGSATLEGTLRNTAHGWVSGTFYHLAVATGGINKTGDTKYALVSREDVDNSAPVGEEYVYIRMADYASTTSDPYLLIEWVLPGERPRSRYKLLVLDAPYAIIETWESLVFTRERFSLGTFEITVPEDYTQAAALVQYNRVLIVRGDGDWDNQVDRLWGMILDIKRFYKADAGPDVGGSGEGAAFVTAIGVTYTDYYLNSRCYPLPGVTELTLAGGPGWYNDGWIGTYEDIDEGVDNHDSDATYISADTKGSTVIFNLENYTDQGAAIGGIRVLAVSRAVDSEVVSPYILISLDDHRTFNLIPNDDGVDSDWAGSYTDIDDTPGAPDEDATYISSSTAGHKQSVEMPQPGTGSRALIISITGRIRARKTLADTITIRVYITIDGTRYYSNPFTLTTSYAESQWTWEWNPDKSGPWEVSDFDDWEYGVEVVTRDGGEARVTQMYVEFVYAFKYELEQVEDSYLERYVDIPENPFTLTAWTDGDLDSLMIGAYIPDSTAIRITAMNVRVYHRAIQTTDHIDDVLKAWVDANLGAGADADRQVTGFTDEADENAGASATYEIGYNLLLQRFLELCKLHNVGMDIVGAWAGRANRLDGGAISVEKGALFGPAYHGLSLADGVAFIRIEGVDLSGYAGTEGSDTPYKFKLIDSAGAEAEGYIGAADAAEALGGELLSNEGFETAGGGGADIWADWVENAGDGTLANEVVLIHGGSDAAKVTGGATPYSCYFQQNSVVTAGKLYKFTFWTRGDGTNAGHYLTYDATHAQVIHPFTSTGITGTSYTQVTVYVTAPAGCTSLLVRLGVPPAEGGIAYFDDVSVKEVTDVGADGVHIVSALNGSTQNWASVESGLDYNDTYTFEVLAAYQYQFQTTVPEGINRTHSQGVNTPVVISRGRGIVRILDYELDVVSARNVLYMLGESDGLKQAVQVVAGDGPALAKQDYGLLLKQDGWPILLSHIPGRYRREAVLDVEGADDTTQLTSQADKFLGDEGAELEMVKYEHSAVAIYVPLEDFVPGDFITFYDEKLNIGPLQPKVEMIRCAIGGDGVERYEVQLGVVKRPALSEDAAFRAVAKRKTLYVKSS